MKATSKSRVRFHFSQVISPVRHRENFSLFNDRSESFFDYLLSFSTESKSFSTVGKRKPDLGGPGLKAIDGTHVHPIIADPILKASRNLLHAEQHMSERFLKCVHSELTEYLVKTNAHAFVLSYIIAGRARREPNHPDGLKVGEALIGDWKDYGFTRQQYRTALKLLCQIKFLKIIETNRTRKKSTTDSTTGTTTAGTRVKILNSDIWDINIIIDNHCPNHSPNHCPTTDQPLTNHEQEGIRKKKNEKERERVLASLSFGKFVQLQKSEYDSLAEKHGKQALDAIIEKINDHCESTGQRYRGYAATIRNWFRREKNVAIPLEKPESVLSFLQQSLGMERIEDRFGIVEVTSPQGYTIAKFDKKDLPAARKWVAERKGKVNGYGIT